MPTLTRTLRWLLALAAVTITAFILLPAPAWATTPAPAWATTPDMPTGGAGGTLFVISAPAVTLIAAIVIPLLNGVLTKATWSSWVKGLVTLILNGVVALFTTGRLADGTAVFGEQMLFTWFLGFATSMLTYLGVYRPARITSSVVEVNGVEVLSLIHI